MCGCIAVSQWREDLSLQLSKLNDRQQLVFEKLLLRRPLKNDPGEHIVETLAPKPTKTGIF